MLDHHAVPDARLVSPRPHTNRHRIPAWFAARNWSGPRKSLIAYLTTMGTVRTTV